MKTNIVIDISPSISCLAILVFEFGPKCFWPIKLKDSLKCNISRKKLMIKFIFGMPKVPKTRSFHIFAIAPKKWGMKLIFAYK